MTLTTPLTLPYIVLMTILAIVIALYLGLVLGVMLRFMAHLMEKNHQYQLELGREASERVIVVVKETARAVSEAIAPPAPNITPEYETQPNQDQPINPKEFEAVPWYLQQDGRFGTDPTDTMDEWLTGNGEDVNRVANIRPGEDIVPGPDVPTNLPGLTKPNMGGEYA